MNCVLEGPQNPFWKYCQNKVQNLLLLSKRKRAIIPVGNLKVGLPTKERRDVLQGTLALTVLKTLDLLGAQHGYGIARRIEQISGGLLGVNQGTLNPFLLKLEQQGSIASEWARRKTTVARASIGLRGWPQTTAGGDPRLGANRGNHCMFFQSKAEDLA